MKMRKKVVLATGILALLFLAMGGAYQITRLPDPIALDTSGYPSIGSGQIELVVFEDLCCTNCRVFTEEIFPQIASRFVETGKARLTVIPVAFGENSKPLANAALGVYKTAPSRFIPFVLELLHSEAEDRESILKVATKIGGIDLAELSRCIDEKVYYQDIEKNMSWAKRLMGEEFGTPTLFVNGIMTSTASFNAVKTRIKQIEKQK